MPKSRTIRVKFEPNRAAAKSVNQRVIASGKKKSAPGMLKADNPRG